MTPTLFEDPATIEAATIVDFEAILDIDGGFRLGLGAKNIAQLWNMTYPNESPYGLLGRLVYLHLDMAGR